MHMSLKFTDCVVYIVYMYVDCMVEMLATWRQNAPSYATSSLQDQEF